MKQYHYTTVSRNLLGDLHTPVSTYLKVRDIFPQSALMESSDYHGSENNGLSSACALWQASVSITVWPYSACRMTSEKNALSTTNIVRKTH